jgi:cytochrome c oxidase subunit II
MTVKLRQIITVIGAGFVIVGGGLLIGQLYKIILPGSASAEATAYDRLFQFAFSIAGMIVLLVDGVLVYCIIYFRRKPGDLSDGPSIYGNRVLEIVWTIIPIIIVSVLSIYSYNVLQVLQLPLDSVTAWFCGPLTPAQALAQPISGADLVINVKSRQYAWEFSYPDFGNISSPELHVPIDQTVLLRLTSEDVIHAFWVPQFRIKQDAVPGAVTELRFVPNTLGTYTVICAELCGMGHSAMRAPLVIESPDKFKAWGDGLMNNKASPTNITDAGRNQFIREGCGACHTLKDAGAGGQLGPALDGLGARASSRISGSSAPDYVRQSILDPKAYIVPGYMDVMPSFKDKMTDQELGALVGYLLQQ